jgi:hypothetical protein
MSRYLQRLQSELGDLSEWEYAGGSRPNSAHIGYFILKFGKEKDFPPIQDHCSCGHRILEQCFVYNNRSKQIKTLGNCCIKKYITKCNRTCEKCGGAHRNRKHNTCNACTVSNPHKCELCNRTYSGKSSYNRHCKTKMHLKKLELRQQKK